MFARLGRGVPAANERASQTPLGRERRTDTRTPQPEQGEFANRNDNRHGTMRFVAGKFASDGVNRAARSPPALLPAPSLGHAHER